MSSSVTDFLFINCAFEAGKEALKVDEKVSQF